MQLFNKHTLRERKNSKLYKIALILLLVSAVLNLAALAYKQYANDNNLLGEDYYTVYEAGAPLEDKYARRGSFETASVTEDSGDSAVGKIHVYYPAEAKSSGKRYPLVIVVNPKETPASSYLPFLDRLASWGFIVAGNEDADSGNGDGASLTLGHMLYESSVMGYIDSAYVGITGYSLGGAGALSAATTHDDGFLYKAIFTGSAPYPKLAESNGWDYDASKISAAYFMTASTSSDDDKGIRDINEEYGGISPLKGLWEIYAAMPEDVPKLVARAADSKHDEMLIRSDGYMTAWMLYWLTGDEEAGAAFLGSDAEILSNPNWQDLKVGL